MQTSVIWRRAVALACMALWAFTCAGRAERLRVGAQMSGTLGWELAYLREKGLDKAAGLDLEIVDLATTDAGKVAIASGAVDVILSDWIWVARQRSLGDKLVFSPYSNALGAVMARSDAPISSLRGLAGTSIGVAGSLIDKSWLMLRAFAKRDGVDLAAQTRPACAAPPLINQKTLAGELDAALQFWNFCVPLQAKGFRPLIEIVDVDKALGARDAVALIGVVFKQDFAATQPDLIERFAATARKAREAVAAADAAWLAIMAKLRESDSAVMRLFRARYAAALPRRPVEDEEVDARTLLRAVAEIGGAELVGAAKELDPGVYHRPRRR